MSFVLGIDIGTSYTAAAIGRRRADGSLVYEALELGSRKTAVPTVVYLDADGSVVVGEAAERRAIEHPDRVVREFKRRIGDETPIIVGDLSVAAEDIFGVLAQWVVERAEEHEGSAPAVIAVSHPATWGDHRLGLIRAALAGVGLANVEFVSEPEAAGLHYLARQKVETGQAIAVYDLGGGTFDVALLRKHEDDTFRVIGAPAGIERLGGADFDQQIFEHVKSLSNGAFDDVDERIPDAALALARVRRECTDAKEALSFDAETFVPILLPGTQTRVRLIRSEFEQMIDAALRRTIETLRRTVTSADLELDDLTTVLLIGGSSRIPAVAQLISVELELPVAIDSDPKASISLGAAVAAARLLEPVSGTDAVVGAEPGSDLQPTDNAARDGAAAPSGVVVLPHHMSVGLRATVLAGAAAALLAILIPVTPLALGTQERPGNGDPGGTTGEGGNAADAGNYVTGESPETVADEADPDPVPRDAVPPLRRPLSPANSATPPSQSPAPAPSGSPATASQDDASPADTPPSNEPVVDPVDPVPPVEEPPVEPPPVEEPPATETPVEPPVEEPPVEEPPIEPPPATEPPLDTTPATEPPLDTTPPSAT